MAHQMTIILTDQEYSALTTEATRSGKQPEILLHELMAQRFQAASQTKRAMTGRELAEKLYREGKLVNLATQRPMTQKEQEERERLVQKLTGGTPASEMIIEDRGPY